MAFSDFSAIVKQGVFPNSTGKIWDFNFMMNNDFYYDKEFFTNDNSDVLREVGQYEFVDCTFTSIDLTFFNFSQAKFFDCHFIKCNLSNANLTNVIIRGLNFKQCRLMGINWCNSQALSTLSFSDSQLDYSVFLGLKLSQAAFESCSLKDVDFSECDLTKANFTHAILENASFNKANLSGADFRSAKDYLIDPRHTDVKKAKFSMPEALILLRSLDIIIE